MKRFLAWILMLLTIFSVLTACGQNGVTSNEDQDDQESVESEYRDLYEQEFWAAYDKGTDEWRHFWPEPISAQKEYVREVAYELEARLNITLQEEEMQIKAANVSKLFATGDYRFSWMAMKGTGWDFYQAGYLQYWDEIPGLDIHDKTMWGRNTEANYSKYDGEHTWLMPDMVTVTSNNYGLYDGAALLYNSDLIAHFNTTDPHELYEQGKWKWADFEAYLETVTEVRDDGSRLYGLSVYPENNLLGTAIFTNGGQYVRQDENGVYKFALNEPCVFTAMDWTLKMFDYDWVIADDPSTWDRWAKENATFILADGCFGTSSSGSSKHWGLDNIDNIEFIRFPTGPDVAEGQYVTEARTGHPWGTALMFGCDREDSGYVWAIQREIELELDDEDGETKWRRRIFFSDASYEHYMARAEKINYVYDLELRDANDAIGKALNEFMAGKKTAAQAIGEVSSLAQNSLDMYANNK